MITNVILVLIYIGNPPLVTIVQKPKFGGPQSGAHTTTDFGKDFDHLRGFDFRKYMYF